MSFGNGFGTGQELGVSVGSSMAEVSDNILNNGIHMPKVANSSSFPSSLMASSNALRATPSAKNTGPVL